MKKAAKITTFSFLAVIILLAIAFPIYITVSNDKIAADTAKGLAEYPLPDNTVILETVSAAGKFIGNGNGMQYLGALLVETDLSREQLQEYYKIHSENIIVTAQDNSILELDFKVCTYKSYDHSKKDRLYSVCEFGSTKGYFLGDILMDFEIRGH